MCKEMFTLLISEGPQCFICMSRLLRAACLMAVLLLPLEAVSAATATVDCDNPPSPGTFSSINAALNSLDFFGPHTINVTGTCVENLNLQGRTGLTIQGPAGSMATIINAADPPFWTIAIGRARQIQLRRLTVRGGSIGIRIDSASSVDIFDCIVEENPGTAIVVDENSTVRLNQIILRNNQSTGLAVTGSAHVSLSLGGPNPQSIQIHDNAGAGISVNNATLLGFQGTTTIQNNGGAGVSLSNATFNFGGLLPLRIAGNGGAGINANGSFVAINGGATIENNLSVGLALTGGRAILNGTQAENLIRGNGFGVSISGATVTFNGQNTIQNNGATGVSIGGGTVNFNALVLPDGTQRVNTIEGHILGLNVAAAASASFVGPNRIRGNGHPNATGMFRGGIRIGTVSRIQLDGGNEITDNIGPGLFADFNGAISVNGTRIARNTEDGVRVTRLSIAGFGVGNTFEGNGGSNISCDATALIFGELAGVSLINCRNIERELGPPRPGAIRDLPPQ